MGNAITKIRKLMSDFGVTIEHLADGVKSSRAPTAKKATSKGEKSPKTAKGARAAKYVDPKSGATWSGLGRIPSWIAKAKNRDAFLIDKPAELAAPAPAAAAPVKRASAKKVATVTKPARNPAAKTAAAQAAPVKVAPKEASTTKAASKKKATESTAAKEPTAKEPVAKKAPAKRAPKRAAYFGERDRSFRPS